MLMGWSEGQAACEKLGVKQEADVTHRAAHFENFGSLNMLILSRVRFKESTEPLDYQCLKFHG
jgi:hypothetical protein